MPCNALPQANAIGRGAKSVREFLEKNYSDEAIETDDLTVKLVIKALLEVSLPLQAGEDTGAVVSPGLGGAPPGQLLHTTGAVGRSRGESRNEDWECGRELGAWALVETLQTLEDEGREANWSPGWGSGEPGPAAWGPAAGREGATRDPVKCDCQEAGRGANAVGAGAQCVRPVPGHGLLGLGAQAMT